MSERKIRHLDDLFGGPAEPAAGGEQIEEIDESLIDPFPGHPFHMYQGRLREEMIESIRDFGVLTPITLWAQENGRYYILAGHNRDMCNREVGNKTIRSVVKRGLTMGEAKIIVTHTNIYQRGGLDALLPSERAFVLKMELDGLKEARKQFPLQKQVDELEKMSIDGKVFKFEHLKSRDSLAKTYNLKAVDIQRYVSLTRLCKGLLDLLDEGKVPFHAILPVTRFPEGLQQALYQYLCEEGAKLSVDKAQKLAEQFKEGLLTPESMHEILFPVAQEEKANKGYRISNRLISRYFQDRSPQEIEQTIEMALKQYFDSLQDGR